MPANKVPTTTTWSLKKISLLSMRALCTEAGDMSHSHTSSELGSSEETAQAEHFKAGCGKSRKAFACWALLHFFPFAMVKKHFRDESGNGTGKKQQQCLRRHHWASPVP